jgi:hypothetical protein
LATGTEEQHPIAVLFQRVGTRWYRVATTAQIPWVVSQYGLDVAVLEDLAKRAGPVAELAMAAAAIYQRAAAKSDQQLTADSAIVEADGARWFAVAVPPTRLRNGFSVVIYRWEHSAWGPVGLAGGLELPDLNGPGSIAVVHLTGSLQPDFLVTGNGADWRPAAVVSDIGGTWHAVPVGSAGGGVVFDYAGAQGRLLGTEFNYCGCAFGPESYLWTTYRDGAFLPTSPPGPVPTCTVDSLLSAIEPAPVYVGPPLSFTKVACADGWALALGRGAAYTGNVVGLFEQQGDKWKNLSLDDGAALADELDEYDFPPPLFARLGAELGPEVAPEVSAAWPPERLGLPSSADVSGVMTVNGADWLVAATQSNTGFAENPPWVSVAVLRWSGKNWDEVGHVDRIADHGSIVGSGLWYWPVSVKGSAEPGFRITGSPLEWPSWSVVVVNLGRGWQVVRG